MIINGFMGILIPFTYFDPDFYCLDKTVNPVRRYKCSEASACNNKDGYEIEILRTSIVSIHKLWCENRNKRSLAIFLMNFVASLLVLITNILADKYGRLIVLRFGAFLFIINSLCGMFTVDYVLNTIINIFLWWSGDIFLSLIFIYYSEMSIGKYRKFSNTILFYFYSFGVMLAYIVNIWIKDFRVFYIIMFGAGLVTSVFYFKFEETIFFLFQNKKVDKLRRILSKIKKENEKDEVLINKIIDNIEFEKEEEEDSNSTLQLISTNILKPHKIPVFIGYN